MQFENPIKVVQLAEMVSAKLLGNELNLATGINEIHKVTPGDITFVDHPKYYEKCLQSAATIILINQEMEVPAGKTLLFCNDPFSAYVSLVKHFRPFQRSTQSISESAVIGEGTIIQPQVFIGNHVQIGKNCLIHPNVTIYDHSIIGDHVIIQAGTVIGGDAFYFKKRTSPAEFYDKLESCGRVRIEDHVEIGSGCTIDKGVSGETIIGWGSKLDNQIHVGHGTVIGKNCLIAAQVGIAGKTKVGDNVIIWGQVGVNKDLVIGDNAIVLGQSGVTKTIKGNQTYFGTPAKESRAKLKEMALIQYLPELMELLKKK
jgi:UDP-3-O-[3-hydroxymyristoyl] glucosamine N-acyltransferase